MDDLDAARPAANLVGAHTRQPLCEHVPVGRLELDGITSRKRAVAAHDADCQEAAPMHDQRALRALVDDEAADGGLRVAKPELEGAVSIHVRRGEARASTFARDDRTEDVAAVSRSDHRWNSRSRREPGGRDLACHSPAPERTPFTEHRAGRIGAVSHQLRTRDGRMRRIDPVDLGQKDQQPRPRQNGDLGRECVVVAERDLVRRRRVVLVHDGNDAELQQRLERIADVDVARALGEIRRREQDLRGLDSFRAQRGVPGGLKTRLPHRRSGLKSGRVRRPPRQPEARQAERDRA